MPSLPAAGLNLSYVIDVNFGRSPDPALAVAHVEAIGAAGLWPLVRAVEIGNEVDIYAKPNRAEQKAKGHRNMSYDCASMALPLELGAYNTGACGAVDRSHALGSRECRCCLRERVWHVPRRPHAIGPTTTPCAGRDLLRPDAASREGSPAEL